MSGYTPRTDPPIPQVHASPRACGLTRRELRNLRALSGCKKPHKCIAWLREQTHWAKYGDPATKRMARAYGPALERTNAIKSRRAPAAFFLSYPVA